MKVTNLRNFGAVFSFFVEIGNIEIALNMGVRSILAKFVTIKIIFNNLNT